MRIELNERRKNLLIVFIFTEYGTQHDIKIVT